MAIPRPTRLAMFLALAGFIIGTAAMNTGNNLLYLVFSLLLAMSAICLVMASRHLGGVDPELHWPEEVFAGRMAKAWLEVENPRRRNLLDLEISVQVKKKKTRLFLAHFPYLAPEEKQRVKASVKFPQRGAVHFKPLRSRSSYPFGFFATHRSSEAPEKLTVYPALLDEPTPTPHSSRAADLGKPGSSQGNSSDLRNLRGYNPGDDPRQIHWKASAKSGQFLVKEHAQPAISAVHIYLDQYLENDQQKPFFERAVSRAATWIVDLSSAGVSVGLSATELEDGPLLERRQMLEFLAEVKPSRRTSAPPGGAKVFSARLEMPQ